MKLLYDIKNIALLLYLYFNAIKYRLKCNNNYKKSNTIHSLSFREFSPEAGVGGGAYVLSCQKILFGDYYNNLKLIYSFKENENNYSIDKNNSLWDLWGGVLFTFESIKNDVDCTYITHDYATAYGLYLMHKKYVLISHLQGPRVEEKLNFGEKFSRVSELIIKYSEKKAFKNSLYVCFPSFGAYQYFCSSKYKSIKKDEFKLGHILYNTLYSYPEPDEIGNLKIDTNCITILSIGQLTKAKGIDRHCFFLERYLKNTDKKIRYIIVGDGPLRNDIINDIKFLSDKYNNFSFYHIKKCSYRNMQYLQNISDIYLMLHRISIFDISTLEMMNKSKVVILSEIGGNIEFNKNENIIFINNNNFSIDILDTICSYEKRYEIGKRNKEVYLNYFSNACFRENYWHVFNDLQF